MDQIVTTATNAARSTTTSAASPSAASPSAASPSTAGTAGVSAAAAGLGALRRANPWRFSSAIEAARALNSAAKGR